MQIDMKKVTGFKNYRIESNDYWIIFTHWFVGSRKIADILTRIIEADLLFYVKSIQRIQKYSDR